MLPIHQNANEYGDFLHETYANLLVAHLACALIGFPTDMQKQTRNQNFFLYIHMQTIAARFWNCLLHLRAHSMLRPRQMFGPLCICMQGWSYVLRFSFTLTHTHTHTHDPTLHNVHLHACTLDDTSKFRVCVHNGGTPTLANHADKLWRHAMQKTDGLQTVLLNFAHVRWKTQEHETVSNS